MTRKEAAAKGGRETLKRHGRRHMAEIGRKGYQTTLARYFMGDALAYRRWLIARGWNAIVEQLADRELDRRINAGERVACIELPPMLDEDYPF